MARRYDRADDLGMTVSIDSVTKTEHGTHITATCEKTTGCISIHSWGVQAVCQNSSHRVWRGGGKHFPTVAAALAHYKSGEMQAIIRAAAEYVAAQQPVEAQWN